MDHPPLHLPLCAGVATGWVVRVAGIALGALAALASPIASPTCRGKLR